MSATSPTKHPIYHILGQDLAIQRLMLLIGGVGIIIFSHLADAVDGQPFSALSWDRYAVALIYLSTLFASYTLLQHHPDLSRFIHWLSVWVYPLEIAYILLVEDFSIWYTVGWLITVMFTALIQETPKRLRIFTIYQMLLIIPALVVTGRDVPEIGLVVCSLLIIYGINYLIHRQSKEFMEQYESQEAEAQLSQGTLRSLVDSSQDLIWAVNQNFELLVCNPAFQRVTQDVHGVWLSPGDSLRQISEEGEGRFSFRYYYRMALQGEASELEYNLDVRGKHTWYAMAFNPITGAEGQIQGVSVFARDISERKEMERNILASQTRYLMALAGTQDGVWEWDLADQQLFLSPSLCDVMGVPAESTFSGEEWYEFIWPEDRLRIGDAIRIHIKEDTHQLKGEFRLKRTDGKWIWLLAKGTASRDQQGRVIRISGTMSDITARKERDLLLNQILSNSASSIIAFEAERNPQGEIEDFRCTLANPSAVRLINLPTEQVIGLKLTSILPEGTQDDVFQRYQQVVETGQSALFQQHYEAAGQVLWLQFLAFKLEEGLAVQITDVTESHANRERLRRLSLVAEKTHSMVLISDSAGTIEWVNEACAQRTGYSLAEMVGQRPNQLLAGPLTNQEVAQSVLARMEAGLATETEIVQYDKAGNPFWVAMNITPIADEAGNIQSFVSIEHDITERKATEQALREAKEAAEAAAGAKSAFLATMSHEIRTPMNAVIGMTGLLLDTPLDQEQLEYVQTIRVSGDNLLTVINDILDFSKIDAGQLELEEQAFSLADTIEDILDLMSTKAQDKGLELIYEMAPEVPRYLLADATRLSQILVNLIGNSIKFTHKGEVSVSICTVEDQQTPEGYTCLQMSVRDTGIGIPKEKQARLFQPFSQVDASTTRKYGGTGLGLAICRMLVSLMGGRIWIDSEEGKGTTFSFTLMVKPDHEQAAKPKPLSTADLSGVRVVLVDDNQTNLVILSKQCQSWGLKVFAFQDPVESLTWLTESGQQVDLAIIDAQMPEMDGKQLAQHLKAHPKTEQIPIILLSSMGGGWSRNSQHLFEAALSKPVRRGQLQAYVLQALGRRAAQPGAGSRPSTQTRVEMPPLRILLVEDNAINQKVALRMLGKLGYQADVAGNGLEALKAVEMTRYDLIFMDMQMPEMDGLEATKELVKRYPSSSERPTIIAMTANALKGDRERCLEAGMDDYISKPVKLPRLSDAILRWFGQEKPAKVGDA